MNKLKGFITLLRPFNCLMASIAVLIGFLVSAGFFLLVNEIVLLMASAFLVCGAGQTINDIADYKIDKKIKPTRVLPAGVVSLKEAKVFVVILFLIGNALALVVSITAFSVAVVFSLILFFYSVYLKKWKYLGNLLIALSSAVPLIYGASIINNYLLVGWFAGAAFFASYSREVIKDFEDIELGERDKTSLPVKFGCNANIFVYVSYSIAVLTGFFAAAFFRLNLIYLTLLLLASFFFVVSGIDLSLSRFNKAQKNAKIGMLIALISFASVIL